MKDFKDKNNISLIKFINGDRYWITENSKITYAAHYIIVTDKNGISTAYPHIQVFGISYGHKLSQIKEYL